MGCGVGRDAHTRYATMKVQGMFYPFLLDREIGTFLEPELFDKHVGNPMYQPVERKGTSTAFIFVLAFLITYGLGAFLYRLLKPRAKSKTGTSSSPREF